MTLHLKVVWTNYVNIIPNIVYNVYGSTEVPPIVLYSEEENIYTKDSVPEGCSVKLHNTQICAKWSTQKEYWISGDCVEGDTQQIYT